MKDIPDIIQKLHDVREKYVIFGILLKLPMSTVDAIHGQRLDPFINVAFQFVKHHPNPTWRIVLDALRDPLINGLELAEQIKRHHFSINPGIFYKIRAHYCTQSL